MSKFKHSILFAATALAGIATGALQTQAEAIAPSAVASAVKADDAVVALVPEAIKANGVLRLSAYGNTPYTMTNEKSELFGAVIDLGTALAATMGLKAEIDNNGSVAASKVAVESDRYDAGMGPFLDSPKAEEDFNIVNWVKVTPGFVYRAGETYGDPMDFCGKNLATVSGSVPVERNMEALKKACADAGKPEQTVNAYGDQNATIVAVLSGRDDAAVMGSASALYVAKQQGDKLGGFSAETDVFGVGLYSGFGLPKANTELAEALLAAMKSLQANGTYKAIFDDYGLGDLMVDDIVLNPITGAK